MTLGKRYNTQNNNINQLNFCKGGETNRDVRACVLTAPSAAASSSLPHPPVLYICSSFSPPSAPDTIQTIGSSTKRIRDECRTGGTCVLIPSTVHFAGYQHKYKAHSILYSHCTVTRQRHREHSPFRGGPLGPPRSSPVRPPRSSPLTAGSRSDALARTVPSLRATVPPSSDSHSISSSSSSSAAHTTTGSP